VSRYGVAYGTNRGLIRAKEIGGRGGKVLGGNACVTVEETRKGWVW